MRRKDAPSLIADANVVEIPIGKLHLDTGNVRFKHLSKRLSEEQIQKMIQQEPDTGELCEQILSAGVVYEPLVINSDHVVIEGNRRLVCLNMLQQDISQGKLEGLPEDKFNIVKCRILPKNTDDKTVDLYLATIHVRSKKPWKLFNRAKHIYRLNRSHGMSYDDLASYLGMGKVTIQRNVLVYKLILDYSRRFPDDKEWFHKFTYFDELFKRKDLKEFREKKDFLHKFAAWVHDGKFHDHRDVRQLVKIISDEDAMDEFKLNNFQSALRVLEKNDPSLSNQIFKRIRETVNSLKSISRTELESIKTNPAKMRLIIDLEAETKSLLAEIEAMRSYRGTVAS